MLLNGKLRRDNHVHVRRPKTRRNPYQVGLSLHPDQLIRLHERPNLHSHLNLRDQIPEAYGFTVRESRDASGLGLFVERRIQSSECLFADPALLSLVADDDLPQVFAKYSSLPVSDKTTLDGLSTKQDLQKDAVLAEKLRARGYAETTITEMTRVCNIILANAFNFRHEEEACGSTYHGENPVFRRAVFPLIARINHSCVPNAHVHYRREIGSMVIYALRDIEPGEEVRIAYFRVDMSALERQARAKDWGFECSCEACTAAMHIASSSTTSSSVVVEHEEMLDDLRRCLSWNTSLSQSPSMRSREVILQAIAATDSLLTRFAESTVIKVQRPTLYEQVGLSYRQLSRLDHERDGSGQARDDIGKARRAFDMAYEASVEISGRESPSSRRLQALSFL